MKGNILPSTPPCFLIPAIIAPLCTFWLTPVPEPILSQESTYISIFSSSIGYHSNFSSPTFEEWKTTICQNGLLEKLGHLTKEVPCDSLSTWFPSFLGGRQGLTTPNSWFYPILLEWAYHILRCNWCLRSTKFSYVCYLCCPHQSLTTWKRYRLISLGSSFILQGSGNDAVAAPFALLSIVMVKFQHKRACADVPVTTAIHLCYTMYSHLSCIFVSVTLLWRLSKATWSSMFYDLALPPIWLRKEPCDIPNRAISLT